MDENATVTRTELFHLGVGEAMTLPVQVEMFYTETDPWAVQFTFRSGHDVRVLWTFGRALLAAGLTHRAGEGDVRVRPNLEDRSSLTIEVHASEQDATFIVPSSSVAEFLDATYRVTGPERARVVVDEEFDTLDWSHA